MLTRPHTALELANFSAGTGHKRYSMPYHVIRMARETGDSKSTVGWAASRADAKKQMDAMRDANGVESERARLTYYIRDIRDGTIYGR